MNKQNLQNLRQTLVNSGYNPPKYEQFEKDMMNEDNLKKAYSTLKDEGYEPPEFDVFKNDMGYVTQQQQPKVEEVQQDVAEATAPVETPKQAGTPFKPSAAKMAAMNNLIARGNEMRQGWQQTSQNLKRATSRNTVEGRKQAQLGKFQAQLAGTPTETMGVTPHSNNGPKIEGGGESVASTQGAVPMGVSIVDGKPVTKWMLPDGSLTTDIVQADEANYYAGRERLHQEFKTRMVENGLDPESQLDANKQALLDQMKIIDDKLEARHKELAQEPSLTSQIGEALRGGQTGMYDSPAPEDMDWETQALRSAKRALENAMEVANEAGKSKDESNLEGATFGFLRGLGNKAFDIDTWDMGMHEMQDAGVLLTALNKADKGQALTASEQALLDTKAMEMAVNAFYSQDLGRGFKAGQVTAEAIPFMVEMAINPASAVGKGAQKQMMRYALNRFGKKAALKAVEAGAKGATKAGLKALPKSGKAAVIGARVVGDVAGAGAMTFTTGAMHTAADAMNRMSGETQFNITDSGRVVFAGQNNRKGLRQALDEAVVNNTIQNYSEMVGGYFEPLLAPVMNGVGSTFGKILAKDGLSGLKRTFQKIGVDKWVKGIDDFLEKTQWNGPIGEYAEEVYGNMMNAALVGDMNWGTGENGVFNKDMNIDTALGVAYMGGIISTFKTVGYVAHRYEINKNLKKADSDAQLAFGGTDQWNDYKNILLNGDDATVRNTLRNAMTDQNLTEAQKKAIFAYAGMAQEYKGAVDGENKARAAENGTPKVEAAQAYDEGYTLSNAIDMQDAKNMYLAQREKAIDALSEDVVAQIDNDTNAYIERQGDNMSKVARDYINAKAKYEGMNDRIQSQVDENTAQVDAVINKHVNQGTGKIHPATLKFEDRKVYIVDGEIVMLPDGTAVDKEKSSESVMAYDSETGKVEWYSPADFLSVDETLDPENEKQVAHNTIAQQITQAEQNKIDGVVTFASGQTVSLVDGSGNVFDATMESQNQDGSITISYNNGENEATVSAQELQAMSDAASKERVRQKIEEADANGNANDDATSNADAAEYALNDEVVLHTDDGDINGKVVAEENEDGIIQVLVNTPQGERIQDYTRNELNELTSEPAAPAEPEVEPMPETEEGKADYMAVTPVRAEQHIYNETGLDEAIANQFVDNKIAEAQAALDEAQKNEPQMGTDIEEYQAAHAQWQQGVEMALQALAQWQAIKDAHEVRNAIIGNEPQVEQPSNASLANADTEADAMSQVTPANTGLAPATGLPIIPQGEHALPALKKVFEQITTLTGRRVVMGNTASIANALGITPEEASVIGGYETNGAIVVNTDYKNPYQGTNYMNWLFGHELTHAIKDDNDPRVWSRLVALVRKSMGDAAFENELEAARKRYAKRYANMEEDEFEDAIAEEVVADWAGRNMLTTRAAAEQLLAQAQEAGIDPKSLTEKIIAYIDQLLDALKNIINPNSEEQQQIKALETAKEVWQDMYKIAVAKHKEAVDERISNEVTQLMNGKGGVVFNEKGDVVAMRAEGKTKLSVLTWEQGGRQALADYLKKQRTIGEEEAKNLLDEMDRLASEAKNLADGKPNSLFGQWSYELVRTKDGTTVPVLHALKKNSEYTLNIDFSTVCKKRQVLDYLMNKLIREGHIEHENLSSADIARINQIIQKHGLEIACAICFVDSRRYNAYTFANGFLEKFNPLVQSLAPGMEMAGFNYANNAEFSNEGKFDASEVDEIVDWEKMFNKNGKPTGLKNYQLNWKGIVEMMTRPRTDSKGKPKASIYEAAMAAIKKGDTIGSGNKKRLKTFEECLASACTSAEEKMAYAMSKHPELRKLAKAEDFVASEGWTNVLQSNEELERLWNIQKGAAGARANEDNTQYLSDVVKKRVNGDIFDIGGYRMQSFSDFIGHMYFDYLQAFADLAAMQLPGHAYTKEPAFVKLFGMMDMKINMSLVSQVDSRLPKDYAGLTTDASGNIVYNFNTTVRDDAGNIIVQGQTFPPEEAFALQQDPRFSKNAGTIAVGLSREHILKLLRDPNIRMVIPYHKSGLPHGVALIYNINEINDYTDSQNTRGKYKSLNDDEKDVMHKRVDQYNFILHQLSIAENRDAAYAALRDVFVNGDASKGNRKAKFDEAYAKYTAKGAKIDMPYALSEKHEDEGFLPKVAADIYKDACEAWDYVPKFDEFAEEHDYFKVLIDFAVYDHEGNYTPQDVIKLNVPEDFNEQVKSALKEDEQINADKDAAAEPIIKEINDYLANKELRAEQDRISAKAASDVTEEEKAFMQSNVIGNVGDPVNVPKTNGSRDNSRDTKLAVMDTPIFVSNAATAVEGIKQEKATGDQWLAMLKKNGGLKAEEDKWIGLTDFLKGKKSVTKDELLQYIADNDVKIEEVQYGDVMSASKEAVQPIMQEFKELKEQNGGDAEKAYNAMVEKYGPDFEDGFSTMWGGLAVNRGDDSAPNAAARRVMGVDLNPINATRTNYTTDGLRNPHEIALTVPTIDPYHGSLPEVHFDDEYTKGKTVAWIRFGDATSANADGTVAKVLVLDEVQSQRHQDAREKGYVQPIADAERQRIMQESMNFDRQMREKYGEYIDDNNYRRILNDEEIKEYERTAQAERELSNNGKRVPDAPWQKNWHELAMKRMLRYAAENGYDKIAWTTGAQQAERYDLSNTVNKIVVESNDDGTYLFNAMDDANSTLHFGERYTPKEIEGIVGKEIASKLIEGADRDWHYELTEGNLKLGGEGMKGFYDQMLPRFMDKYGKKWGVKTADIELNLPNEADRVMHGIDVTPEMKESVMQGQSKFAIMAEERIQKEKESLSKKIQSWITPENIEWAEGKDLNEIINKFGNTPEPIAILPEVINEYIPELEDNYLHSGKAYFVDHAANHHPELLAEEYENIQKVLDEYDDIKDISPQNGQLKLAFIKKLDKGYAVVAEISKEGNKILLHKTFFYKDVKGKRVPFKNKPSFIKQSSVDGSTTISPVERQQPADTENISALDDVVGKVKNNSSTEQVEDKNSDAIEDEERKQKQFEVIQNSNPADENLGDHTWIRSADEIKTFAEALNEWDGDVTPDFTAADAQEALRSGKVKVYSSHPIENGAFVTPSKMQAKDYAGNGKVYEATVNTDDVAWIDASEGQMAKVETPATAAAGTEPSDTDKAIAMVTGRDVNEVIEQRVAKETEAEQQNDKMQYNGGAKFSIVTDPAEIERLENEEYIPAYHAMQLITMDDGKTYLFPPMAAVQGDNYVEGIPVTVNEDGSYSITPTWEKADENPHLAFRMTAGEKGKKIPADAELEERIEKGKKVYYYNGQKVKTDKNGEVSWYFPLKKGNRGDSGKKLTDLDAVLYDPYQHSGENPVNDQFTTAYDRSHLVIVEVRVPKSESTGKSGYKADKAGLGVGTHPWTGGKLKTKKRRQVILSRWDKPMRILSNKEVAEGFKKVLDENKLPEVPFNIVTPAQREELVKLGVKIGEPSKDNAGKAAIPAYKAWLNEGGNNPEGGIKAIKKNVLELFEQADKGTFKGKPKSIGRISSEGKALLEGLSGQKFKEHVDFVLNPSDLNHIRGNHYGANEKDKGNNIPLNDEDILNLADVINQPDAILYGIDKKDGRKLFFFLKNSGNGLYNLTEVCSTKKGNLTAKSYLKSKKKGINQRVMEIKTTLLPTSVTYSGEFLPSGAKIPNLFDIPSSVEGKIAETEEKSSGTEEKMAIVSDEQAKANVEAVNKEMRENPNSRIVGAYDINNLEDLMDAGAMFGRDLYEALRKEYDTPSAYGAYDHVTGIYFRFPNHIPNEEAARSNHYHENTHRAVQMAGVNLAEVGPKALAWLEKNAPSHYEIATSRYSGNALNEEAAVRLVQQLIKEHGFRGFLDANIAGNGIISNFVKTIQNYFRDGRKEDNNRPGEYRRGDQSEMGERGSVSGRRVDTSRPMGSLDEGATTEGEGARYAVIGADDKAIIRDLYEKKVASGTYQFREAVQDSMLSLRRFQEMIAKATGKPIKDYENAYMAENQLSSINKQEQDLFIKDLFEPLLDEVNKLAGAMGVSAKEGREMVKRYLLAKHGLERNLVMAQRAAQQAFDAPENYDEHNQPIKSYEDIYDEMRERDYGGITGLMEESDLRAAELAADDLVNAFESKVDVAKLWQLINACTQATLDKAYKSGLMSKEQYENVSNMYDYYIPLRGFNETTSDEVYSYLASDGGGSFNAPLKKAQGRSSVADDPIATIANMADSGIAQGNKNLVKQAFLRFVMNHPNDLVSVSRMWIKLNDITGEWEAVTADLNENDTPEQIKTKTDAFEAQMEQLAQKDPEHYKRGSEAANIPYRPLGKNLNEHQIHVKMGGEDYILTVNGNPRLAQAVNGMTNPNREGDSWSDKVIEGLNWVGRQMSAFFTTRNPEFVLSNFLRDMMYANTTSWIRESPNYAVRFNLNFAKNNPARMMYLIKKFNDGTLDMNNADHKLFSEFMRNGGETGYTVILNVEQRKAEVEKYLNKKNSVVPGRQAWDWLLENLDDINRAVESCARFTAYMTSRQMGRSVIRSINDAKEVSVNFNKKGAGGTYLGTKGQTLLGNVGAFVGGAARPLIIFWNAAIQGLTNFGRLHKNHTAKALAADAMLFLLPVVLRGLTNGGDDDDKYYDISPFDRRNNICFKIPGTDIFIKIPLGQEQRTVYGMGELLTSLMTGHEKMTAEEIAAEIATMLSTAMPIDIVGEGKMALVPSALKPIAELYANEDFTGAPIYKDTPFNKDDPEWTKANKRTNKYLVDFTRKLNEWTGGDEIKCGYIDLNPSMIEHLFEGVLGGVVTTGNKLVKTYETITGEREYDPKNIFMLSRVLTAPDPEADAKRVNSEYWKYNDEYELTKKRKKKYDKAEDEGIEGAAERVNFFQNSEEYGRYEIMEDHAKDIKDTSDELKEESDPNRRKELEQELVELKRELLNEIYQYNDTVGARKSKAK